MPGIISQVGAQQYEYLKKLQAEMKITPAADAKKEGKDDDIPDLVSTNFEDVANKS